VLLGLARCRHRLGQLEEAQQLLDALLARHSRLPQAVGERGRIALDADRPAEAEGWLRQAVALAPDDRDALYALVQCLQRLDKAEEAHSLGQRLEKLRADLARLEVVLAAVTKTPNDPALRHEAGQICLRYGRKEEGLHWLQTALQLAPAHRPTHETLAEYYVGQGQPELAERHRRLAGLAGPSSPESVP
jgi:predicted Zn-dependent protease